MSGSALRDRATVINRHRVATLPSGMEHLPMTYTVARSAAFSQWTCALSFVVYNTSLGFPTNANTKLMHVKISYNIFLHSIRHRIAIHVYFSMQINQLRWRSDQRFLPVSKWPQDLRIQFRHVHHHGDPTERIHKVDARQNRRDSIRAGPDEARSASFSDQKTLNYVY